MKPNDHDEEFEAVDLEENLYEEEEIDELGPVSRAVWKLIWLLALPFRLLEPFFRIRETISIASYLALPALFLCAIFLAWGWATTYPVWLTHAIEQRFPSKKVRLGDEVSLNIDGNTHQLHLIRTASGNTVVLDLPPMAENALPEFNQANYPGIFQTADQFGLGQFARVDATTYRAIVVDVEKAETGGGFGPLPYKAAVRAGEPVLFELDSLRGRVKVRLERRMRGTMHPYKGGGDRLEESDLLDLAKELGVQGTFRRKSDKLLVGTVADPEKIYRAGLGPSSPIALLALDEEVLLHFKAEEMAVSLELARTEKKRSIPITVSTLSYDALPPLSVETYPELPQTLALVGVGLEAPKASSPWTKEGEAASKEGEALEGEATSDGGKDDSEGSGSEEMDAPNGQEAPVAAEGAKEASEDGTSQEGDGEAHQRDGGDSETPEGSVDGADGDAKEESKGGDGETVSHGEAAAGNEGGVEDSAQDIEGAENKSTGEDPAAGGDPPVDPKTSREAAGEQSPDEPSGLPAMAWMSTAFAQAVGVKAYIVEVDLAVASGFGLQRPKEKFRVSNLPSPTEMAEGAPALWFDRNLMGAWKVSWSWPLVQDFSWERFSGSFSGFSVFRPELSRRAILGSVGKSWNKLSLENLHQALEKTDFDYLFPLLEGFSWNRFRESALATSMVRIVVGFFWAVLIAVPLGIIMGSFTKMGALFELIRLSGLYLPLPAFIPLTIAWAGLAESQKYLFLFICNFVVLLPYTIAAVQAVPQVYLDTASTLGLSRGQIVRRVLIGVSKLEIWKALRFTFGVGWTWIILAEQLGVENGLGYIIWTSNRRGHPEHLYVVVVLIVLLAFCLNWAWTRVIHYLFPHDRSR